MADTNFKGAFWGSEVRKRQARSYWPTEADNTDGVDMSSANTVLLLNGEGTNGAQNNTFLDSSTNNFTITRNGDATQGSLSPFSPTGWSAYFDGTTDGISTASTSAVAFGATANNYTIEFWIYPIAHDGDYDQYVAAGTVRLGYYPGASYGMTVAIDDGSSYPGMYKITGGTAPTLHKWNHIAACRSGGTLRLFVNGVQTGNTHNDTYTHANGTLNISTTGASYSPQCYISNVRIVKGHALYTGNFTPPRLLPLTPYGSNVQYPATANVSSSFTAGNVSFLSLRGPQFVDDSPNRLPITIAGDSKIVPFSPYRNYVDTPRSYSAYFDGTGDYLSFPNSSSLALGSNNFTVECWFYKTANTGNDESIFFMNGTSAAWASMRLSIEAPSTLSNALALLMTNNTSSWTVIAQSAANVFLTNVWNHVAVVRNGTSVRVYLNGNFVINTTFTGSTLTSGTLNYLGDLEWGGGRRPFLGYLSNFRVVNGTAVYTGNFTPPSAPLLTSGNSTIYASVANVNTTFASANTSLLTLQDANIFDRSNNAFTITSFGNVQPTIQNPFGETITSNVAYDATVYAGSGYFDGSGDALTVAGNSALDLTGDFTIELWANMQADNNYLCNGTQIGSGCWRLNLQASTGTALFDMAIGSWAGLNLASAAGSFTKNVWAHFAVTRSGNTFRLFINGAVAATATNSGSLINTGRDTQIGYYTESSGTYYSQWYLSNLRIVKGTALYTSNFVPPNSPSSAVANTSLLLKFQNAGVVDRTGKGDIITLGNGQISTSVYKYGSGSIYFDGTGDGLYLPPSPNYGFGSGDFTIEFWVYFNSTASGQNIIHGYTSASTFDYTIYTGTNTLVYYLSSNGTSWNIASAVSIGSIATGTWYHVALVRSGSTIKPYLNGVAGSATTSSAAIFNSAPPLLLGYNVSVEYFNGYLDDVRITKGQARYDASQSTITIPRKTFNLL